MSLGCRQPKPDNQACRNHEPCSQQEQQEMIPSMVAGLGPPKVWRKPRENHSDWQRLIRTSYTVLGKPDSAPPQQLEKKRKAYLRQINGPGSQNWGCLYLQIFEIRLAKLMIKWNVK